MRPFFAAAAGVILFAAIFFALISVPSASAAPGLTPVVPLGLIAAVLDPSPAPAFLAYAAVCGVGLVTIGALAAVAPLIVLGVRLFAAH